MLLPIHEEANHEAADQHADACVHHGLARVGPDHQPGPVPARSDSRHSFGARPIYDRGEIRRARGGGAHTARDKAHAAVIQAKWAHERALASEDDAARLAAEVARIRSEVCVGVKPLAGRLAAVDMVGMLLIRPLAGVDCGGALLRTCEVLAGRGRHPVPSLLAVGPWQDYAALRAALESFRPKLTAIGLRVCRRKAGGRLAKAAGR